jgi:hypothetical protein
VAYPGAAEEFADGSTLRIVALSADARTGNGMNGQSGLTFAQIPLGCLLQNLDASTVFSVLAAFQLIGCMGIFAASMAAGLRCLKIGSRQAYDRVCLLFPHVWHNLDHSNQCIREIAIEMVGEIANRIHSDLLYQFPQINLFFDALVPMLEQTENCVPIRVLRMLTRLLQVAQIDNKFVNPLLTSLLRLSADNGFDAHHMLTAFVASA